MGGKMKTIHSRIILAAVVAGASAFSADDSCDDYFQRHNKADLVPVSAYTEKVPRSGDIAGFDTLNVVFKNIGNQAIQGPAGGFAANAITIGVRRAGRLTRPYFP